LSGRLGDQVAVSSSGTQIFLYVPSAGSADEAAQVARKVLKRQHVKAPVRTEFWSPPDQEWLDAGDEPSADPVAERRRALARERSVTAGFPPWVVQVKMSSHRDVVALSGHLAEQGWRVRPRGRYVIVGADCEDEAKGLVRELSGDGRADAETAFGVRRVSYRYMRFKPPQVIITGP